MLEMLVSASVDAWLSLPAVDLIRSLWLLALILLDSSDAVSPSCPHAAENTTSEVLNTVLAISKVISEVIINNEQKELG